MKPAGTPDPNLPGVDIAPRVPNDGGHHSTGTSALYYKLDGMAIRLVPLKEYGCFVGAFDATLFSCPMLLDGLPDLDNEGKPLIFEVSAPDDPEFLDRVNAILETNFQVCQFAGR